MDGPYVSHGGHDQFLPDRVDRGVRDLCELLAEVVEQHLRAVGHDGQGDVESGGTGSLLALDRHGFDDPVNILGRV